MNDTVAVPAPVRTTRAIKAAVVTLTRLPVGGFPYSAEEWAAAPAHFPLVGGVVGLAMGALFLVLQPLGDFADAILVLGASMIVTGAFHEDGLADTADALGGAMDREKIFAILKDSRIGPFGAAALTISIVGRAALMAKLGGQCLWALPLVGCAARVGPVWLLTRLPYVSPQAEARYHHVSGPQKRQAIVAAAWVVPWMLLAVWLGCLPIRLVVLVLALTVVTTVCCVWFVKRVGGVTGDLLGAAEQMSELAGLAVLAWTI